MSQKTPEQFGEDHLSDIWDEDEQPNLTAAAIALFRKSRQLCESPIEIMMLAGLIGESFGYATAANIVLSHADLETADIPAIKAHIIVPQMAVPQFRYRADFFVSLYTNDYRRVGLFIECDGHDFHERTKDQAARDRKRDRDLQSLGINILRFTGSEIHADLDACLDQIGAFGCDLIEREWARNGRDVPGYESYRRRKSLGKLCE